LREVIEQGAELDEHRRRIGSIDTALDEVRRSAQREQMTTALAISELRGDMRNMASTLARIEGNVDTLMSGQLAPPTIPTRVAKAGVVSRIPPAVRQGGATTTLVSIILLVFEMWVRPALTHADHTPPQPVPAAH
jgi:hypothetical protein